jgi:VIT1/CCC1 family predicted Fe2+/Mn2+ transporter
LIPLFPLTWAPRTTALILALVLSALVLFGVDVYEAVTPVGDWRKGSLRMVVIGSALPAIGFAIGHLLHTVS